MRLAVSRPCTAITTWSSFASRGCAKMLPEKRAAMASAGHLVISDPPCVGESLYIKNHDVDKNVDAARREARATTAWAGREPAPLVYHTLMRSNIACILLGLHLLGADARWIRLKSANFEMYT